MNRPSDSDLAIGESDLLELGRVARGTWNGWIRSGHVAETDTGLYVAEDVVHVAVLSLLGDGLPMRKATVVWNASSAAIQEAASRDRATLDLVVDLQALDAVVAQTNKELTDALTAPVPFPRPRLVFALAGVLREARASFDRRAQPASVLMNDNRRKTNRGQNRNRAQRVRIRP